MDTLTIVLAALVLIEAAAIPMAFRIGYGRGYRIGFDAAGKLIFSEKS